ncbi:class I SAM-dependent methyltransferase [Parerythrobacter lacustris]|uniref:Class I SAM-dependent methyltransferase n=1 Tax=Parerythrobacter lacustris TaxID=2969984 RepID=A0ABT1XTS3_9SPHN|nr:class I SAM-dependent methyltransferase [Parerythrobacter lacustris]MCR2835032.1 class I SAM-dependent methyltransferase [Parerythrobacter lacustris]
MHMLKGRYVDTMQGLAAWGPLAQFGQSATAGSPYGWRRWAASLLAIYDTGRMVELDLPWWNVAATREVERFLAARPGARVFEWGAGASTVWLARRATEVISVEHDADWLGKFEVQTEPFDNVRLMHRSIETSSYVDAIAECSDPFDLIVVDGRQRVSCLEKAKARLVPNGAILFDDSGRSRYRAGIESCGLNERHFHGRSFCVPYPDHTSLLVRHG